MKKTFIYLLIIFLMCGQAYPYSQDEEATGLTALEEKPATNDLIPIYDATAGILKSVTLPYLIQSLSSSNINWQSLQEIQTDDINWTSIYNSELKSTGVDWTSFDATDAGQIEAELEAVIDLQDLQGAVTDAQVPNDITITSTSINWQHIQEIMSSDINWNDLNGVLNNVAFNWNNVQIPSDSDWTKHNDYPSACGAGGFVTGIGDTLTCDTPAGSGDMTKAVYDTDDDGEVNEAESLAANGANCAAGQAPLGVDASGAVESCFDVWTEAENTAAGYLDQTAADLIYQPLSTVLTTYASITPSANAQTILGQTFAQMRGSLDLEAGTDFYSKSSVDTLLSTKVPYTGATTNLNLGTHTITSGAITSNTSGGQIANFNNTDYSTDLTMRYGYVEYGWYWTYEGSGSGNNNKHQLWSEGAGSTDVLTYEATQDGKMTFPEDATFSSNIIVNGTVDGRDIAADGTNLDTAYGWGNHALAGYLNQTAADLIYQPLAANLTTWAGVTPSANGQALVSAADYAAMRTALGLVIGTNVQAYDADLTDIADGTFTGAFDLGTPSALIGTNITNIMNGGINWDDIVIPSDTNINWSDIPTTFNLTLLSPDSSSASGYLGMIKNSTRKYKISEISAWSTVDESLFELFLVKTSQDTINWDDIHIIEPIMTNTDNAGGPAATYRYFNNTNINWDIWDLDYSLGVNWQAGASVDEAGVNFKMFGEE